MLLGFCKSYTFSTLVLNSYVLYSSADIDVTVLTWDLSMLYFQIASVLIVLGCFHF